MTDKKTIAIIVGGGPAPGINSVIAAAAIEIINRGGTVLGVYGGFKELVTGNPSCLRPLSIDRVSRIHLEGGSIIGTSRENPTGDPQKLETIVKTLVEAGVTGLITIGGDDTAFTSRTVAETADGRIATVHVPKTIDNDLPLPAGVSTFGFQTARDAGARVVQTLMEDAKTTGRWYFVVAMGRKAGHLALGIGYAAGATITIIGEEYGDEPIELDDIANELEGSILKRRSQGRDYGVAVLAEGLAEKLSAKSLENRDDLERDEFGHIRFSEIDLSNLLKVKVRKRLADRGIKMTIVQKNLGYELRCLDPIPFDIEYTKDLGYGAVDFLYRGQSQALVIRQNGRIIAMDYKDLMDPATGKVRMRLVDTSTETFQVAQKYMFRITPEDLANNEVSASLATAGNLTVEELRHKFG